LHATGDSVEDVSVHSGVRITIDKTAELKEVIKKFDVGGGLSCVDRSGSSADQALPEGMGGIDLLLGDIHGSGSLWANSKRGRVGAGESKDGSVPLEGGIASCWGRRGIDDEVDELIEDGGRERDRARPVGIDHSVLIREHFFGGWESREEITKPVEASGGSGESRKERNEGTGNHAILEVKVLGTIFVEVDFKGRSVSGINTYSEDHVDPED
jgi:hypothetical protein